MTRVRVHPSGWSLISLGSFGVVDEQHVIPNDDFRDHDEGEGCWCNPSQDPEEETPLWVHHSIDRRELIEEGRIAKQ